MNNIEFDETEVDYYEDKYNDFNIVGCSDEFDYYLECYVDEKGIHINSGHSINDESETNKNLDFKKLEKLLNDKIKVTKHETFEL